MDIGYSNGSELFNNFRQIQRNDVFAQIRFYERHAAEFRKLNTAERFVMRCYYCNALFAAENFSAHIPVARELLESSIIDGFQFVDGFDVYEHTLEQLVHSLRAVKNYEEAVRTAKQLCRIAPANKKYRKLLKSLLLQKRPEWVLKAFALSVLAASAWTLLNIFSLMVAEAFLPQAETFLAFIQNIALSISVLSVILASAAHYYFVNAEMKRCFKK